MSILRPAGLTANSPFADALDLTFPKEQASEIKEALRPLFMQVGAQCEREGFWRVPRLASSPAETAAIPFQKIPVVKMEEFGQIFRVSFSGGSLKAFRELDLLDMLLATMHQFPHRITRLDASVDIRDLDGPASIAAVIDAGQSGLIKLGRKSVNAGDVFEYMNLDARGVRTGSVYLGKPQREIRMKVYDKRHEQERLGAPDPGPWIRVELTLRNVGITLRDVSRPGAVFWNYTPAVLDPPLDAPVWASGDTGFALPERQELDVWAALRRRVDLMAADLHELGLFADRMGKYGRRMLVGLFAEALHVDGLSWGNAP